MYFFFYIDTFCSSPQQLFEKNPDKFSSKTILSEAVTVFYLELISKSDYDFCNSILIEKLKNHELSSSPWSYI